MAPPVSCLCGECQKCKRREYMKEWYRRPGNAQAQRDSQRRSRERNSEVKNEYDRKRGFRIYDPEKTIARQLLHDRVRTGRITKEPCEVCGSEERIHGHHDDYSKPYDVRWLCARHHGELHRVIV